MTNVGSDVGSLSVVQLTERQRNIFNRLIETGQMSVLDNVLETSASLATHFKVECKDYPS